MNNALQVFPSPPLTCRLSIFIFSPLVVSCHGEHMDVKVFILFPSSLRILLLMIFGAWCLENPLPQGISWLEPDWQPVWHFLIGAWVVIVLWIQHQEERNAAKIFTRPTRRNDTKLDSGAINSSTGSKLWYESEQMFRLPSYLKKKKISQTSWRRPIPNDHLKLRINFKSSKYSDHLKSLADMENAQHREIPDPISKIIS